MANEKYADLTEEERQMLRAMHQESSPYGPTQMPGGPQGINPSLKDPQIKNFSKKRQNRPNILDIAPAEQDKTRVALSGLIDIEQVPAGEGVDWDILAEEAVRMGFPPGMVADMAEKAKTDPKYAQMILDRAKLWNEAYERDPGLREKLMEGVPGQGSPTTDLEEDFPEDFGGDQGAF